jgi:anti-sigma B factor antagonist
MPYELDLATETRGLAAIVRLHGTFDMHGAASFDREIERLLHRDTREILVDLRGIVFIDSIGLRSLVTAHRNALRGRVPLWLVRGGAPVMQLLRMTGMDVTLPLIDELPRRLRRPPHALAVARVQSDMRISTGNR